MVVRMALSEGDEEPNFYSWHLIWGTSVIVHCHCSRIYSRRMSIQISHLLSVRQPLALYRVETVWMLYLYIQMTLYMHATHTIKGKYNFIQPHTWTMSQATISKTNGENKNENVIKKNIFLAINVDIQSHDRNYCIYYFGFIADEIDECPFSLFIIYLHRIRALKPNGEGLK